MEGGIEKVMLKLNPDTLKTLIVDSITGREIIDYKLGLKKGQSITINLQENSGNPYFNVMEPGEEFVAIYNSSIEGNTYEGAADKNGDYTIRVYMMRSAARRNETCKYMIDIALD